MKKTLSILFCCAALSATAQKLPKVQQASVYAPANIKVDGKLNEWGEKFEAYNDVNRMFYTVSNDDRNLYLIARMGGERANLKALAGGITLTIKQPGQNSKAKDAKNVAVTYPVIIVSKGVSLGSKNNDLSDVIRFSPYKYKALKADAANVNEINEFIAKTNKQMESHFKEIQVLGATEIKDPLLPIYNTGGIQAVVSFNDKMEFTYELVVPLKMIENNLGKTDKLNYNIKLNARAVILAKGVPPAPIYMGSDLETNYENHATDFSGEYTLAKK